MKWKAPILRSVLTNCQIYVVGILKHDVQLPAQLQGLPEKSFQYFNINNIYMKHDTILRLSYINLPQCRRICEY